ncbi:hypothetical protein CEXT_114371 [Caerostris extrusa]|uniref:Uncharacterized protein n=1 Tax=Caerostris extrusa TaxID=172846 RepID=A0AAV4Y942_CAEEX|nr:hypothetical protein CEXT_114371 [Caerostris extrusa]
MHHRSQCFGYCSFSLIMFPGTTLRKRMGFSAARSRPFFRLQTEEDTNLLSRSFTKGNQMPKSEVFRESVYLEGGAPEWELATNAAPNGRPGTPRLA